MKYINAGALIQGKRPKTKKALKDAVENRQKGINVEVAFEQTALVHDGAIPGIATLDDLNALGEGVQLSVCGPDPYTNRKWYANVVKKPNGKIVVR